MSSNSSTLISPGLKDPQVERPNPHKLRVIGASLPRTGSMAMYEAMNSLGIRSHHMKEVFYHREQVPLWKKAYSEEGLTPAEWDELLNGYESVQDVPACQFVKELAILNPDAKVIITSRDPKAWGNSLRNSVCWNTPGINAWLEWILNPQEREMIGLMDQIWWGKKGVFAGKGKIDEMALPNHIKDIQDFFEKRGESHRVLIYETKHDQNGYDVICPFLGIEKPEGLEWPNINASKGSENEKRMLKEKTFDGMTGDRLQIRRRRVQNARRVLDGIGVVGLVGGIALVANYWQKGGFKR